MSRPRACWARWGCDVEQVHIGTTSYGRHWLESLAAASWFRMVGDGCPAGGVTDAGRTQQEQVDVFLRYFTTSYAASAKHDPRVWGGVTYWRRPGRPSAATPGSVQARHTYGRALDLNGATKAWVRSHGHRYGWVKDLVRGEDWHMEYQPLRDVQLTRSVTVVRPPVVAAPAPVELGGLEEVLMAGPARVRLDSGATTFVDVSTGAFVGIPNTEVDGVLGDTFGGPKVAVNQRQLDVLAEFTRRVRDQLRRG